MHQEVNLNKMLSRMGSTSKLNFKRREKSQLLDFTIIIRIQMILVEESR